MITNGEQLNLMTKIWMSFNSQYELANGATVVQCSIEYLKNNIKALIDAIGKTGINNIFIWIDGFEEENATELNLQAYAKFVLELSSKGKKTVNLYAGGLSPFIIPFGLSGMVNNPGYGMQKDFEPIKGGLPTAQYYIPTRHIWKSVLDSYELLIKKDVGIIRENFIKDVCACPICKDGIRNGIQDMILYYGELGFSKIGTDGVERRFPSTRALERCAYHFIFSRLIEYRWALKATRKDAIDRLKSEFNIWKEYGKHLEIWKSVLEKL
jgi:hypothetical protein